ncbi:hypothetical protein FisN_2Lh124 [Fistulifera solaris]|uniref:C3H1-type domain-containing protein n=1 Tax=Fistulifera solaris TaxID=1519565 RepID=A0A1Z5JWR5_FISSO|nr:hypothetical protein FisN_2Lh124 [Fistulifera solaris]|eukprot:GAX18470.1 hypothetical protein FisN_2Lh124 [Fistulifera solaris]
MTRLQYSGRAPPFGKPYANSKKWVRTSTVEPANVVTKSTHSWKRPAQEMTALSWMETTQNDAKAIRTSETAVSSGYQVSRNKLVRKDVEKERATTENHKMTTSEHPFIQKIETTPKDATAHESSSSEMAVSSGYQVSRNKLIRNEGKKGIETGTIASCPETTTESSTANGVYTKNKKNSLRRLINLEEESSQPIPHNSDAICKYSRVSKKRKRSVPAKRIQVDSIDDLEEKPEEEEEERGKKLLTDFAYRETKSQGLVRVQKDAVCPTFLQGIECTNVRCLKRHDVPAEQAMPICSFFQRKGMCLKEDCKFRHVKVSFGALNCPNFERKGYCDDVSCKLMHRKRPRVPNQPQRSIK